MLYINMQMFAYRYNLFVINGQTKKMQHGKSIQKDSDLKTFEAASYFDDCTFEIFTLAILTSVE